MKKKLNKRFFSVLSVLFLAASFSFAQKTEVIETEHGIWDVEMATKIKSEHTLTQSTNLLKNYKLVQRTDTVLANIGKTFGSEYILHSSDNQSHVVPIKIVWIFPKPMTNPYDHKVYTESYTEDYAITGDGKYFNSYTLEYDYEFVEGWWTFKVMQGNTVLYEKKFLLINLL